MKNSYYIIFIYHMIINFYFQYVLYYLKSIKYSSLFSKRGEEDSKQLALNKSQKKIMESAIEARKKAIEVKAIYIVFHFFNI